MHIRVAEQWRRMILLTMLAADDEDDDLAEDEVEADPNLLFLQPILRAVAVTQRQMEGQHAGSDCRKLEHMCPKENSGAGTTKQNKCCKRSANLTRQLHGLTDQELALLIVSQLKGTAKDLVDILEVEDLEGSAGHQMVWQILDQDRKTCTRTLS